MKLQRTSEDVYIDNMRVFRSRCGNPVGSGNASQHLHVIFEHVSRHSARPERGTHGPHLFTEHFVYVPSWGLRPGELEGSNEKSQECAVQREREKE